MPFHLQIISHLNVFMTATPITITNITITYLNLQLLEKLVHQFFGNTLSGRIFLLSIEYTCNLSLSPFLFLDIYSRSSQNKYSKIQKEREKDYKYTLSTGDKYDLSE